MGPTRINFLTHQWRNIVLHNNGILKFRIGFADSIMFYGVSRKTSGMEFEPPYTEDIDVFLVIDKPPQTLTYFSQKYGNLIYAPEYRYASDQGGEIKVGIAQWVNKKDKPQIQTYTQDSPAVQVLEEAYQTVMQARNTFIDISTRNI
ncbi:hypothetical protein COV24_04615 [candidate division WWE3 bacterium CG10_big_fil_rev_8_21_14_0_10_32_10]|uniref:Uncharacterized protein n=1 Tax=candidate division WWE3 bacterium CG10_big_fil_rev_8_21_14_0_10_32_10 TaxID=1975090 RepID=A0A2H0RB87_UNCKA|nr:MAG: hypothetical protein COV24_04615 [candidate division WWE3 bacterium CG10_big_fil_rev_8_21_14_0_10_32_10]